ncbi:MAG: PilN domain-containing protein [Hyphomicrobiales bacterium]|nr:hypothetical protein [Hyphomicrobiales bacterium]MDE2017571.1 PilN domain-containing protein [Hyphomicrobiales bacterium]
MTGAATIGERARGAVAWWLDRWNDLLPARIAEWLSGAGVATVHIRFDGEVASLEYRKGRRAVVSAPVVDGDVETAFASLPAVTRRSPFIVDIPSGSVFVRSFSAPRAAARTLPKIAAFEIERNTPFELKDVLHGYVAAPTDGGRRLAVRQAIMRRDLANSLCARIGRTPDDVAALECAAGSPADRPIYLGGAVAARGSMSWRPFMALSIWAVLMTAIGLFAVHRRQLEAIATLDSRIARATAKVHARLKEVDAARRSAARDISAVRAKLDAPRVLDLLNEATRVIPNGAWLAEFRYGKASDGAHFVAFTGHADHATRLVTQVDGSKLYGDATLTDPITPDPVFKAERFTLRAAVRSAAPSTPSGG